MALQIHEMEEIRRDNEYGTERGFQYWVSGLPPGEHALIAEFPPRGWRILRWNDEWHGNWTGNYTSADAALEALRAEMQIVA